MGIRFSKSIKLGNYLRLNISRYGISTTIGKKGASVSVGTRGTYLNLSPALVGINGTGISYRKKIAGGLKKSGKKSNKKKTSVTKKTYQPAEETKTAEIKNTTNTQEILEEYRNNQEAKINLHKYADPVMSKEAFAQYAKELESEAGRELYQYSIEGDEDTIENFVSSFMNNLELAYDVRVNYELEDNILYVDLDLPEIENVSTEYPIEVSGKIVYKKKTQAQLKEEYARTVMSLGIFLSANYFNLSSYIDEIVLSGFNTVRNKNGDQVDQYLYSVRYTRDLFEKTDLSEVDDPYEFILRFENRINMSSNYSFKAIKPYEMESKAEADSIIDDALLGLKELGYKTADINRILPQLMEKEYASSAECLKEGLRLLNEKR
ncbi:MAG: DUF4236 domain-containing protein [Erysipelotrichaceae bacterium]|nr:DUF4236 domain-containing protein [Erysipelotrichaceae bacterium]